MKIEIKCNDARLVPTRAHPTDAGADLKSNITIVLHPGEQYMFDTGVAIKIPINHVGMIFNRSSQGKLGVQIPNSVGIIDSDYRGNLKVILRNTGALPYEVIAFETKIAQLVIVPISIPEFVYGDYANWNDTARGTGGFGSTGG